ncbi:MAG: class I SAM-dependent methyltransferase [Solirubrobacterales bacterium]
MSSPDTATGELLAEVDAAAGAQSQDDDTRALYDQLAPSYEHFRAIWLRLAGDPAEEAMLEDLRATLRPGASMLDVGAGTGALSRKALEIEPTVDSTMLDASPEMLGHAGDIPGRRIVGDACSLPFSDGCFDLVVSAWVIETVDDPMRAVSEMLRVLAPDGNVFYTFTSLPRGFVSRAGTGLLRRILERQFAGHALPEERIPYHDCGRSHRRIFMGGLTQEIALQECCEVPPSLASRPA